MVPQGSVGRLRDPIVVGSRVYVLDDDALLALSPDYRSMGRAAADLVKKVLAGSAPRTAAAPPANLTINATTARRLRIPVPADLMLSAEIVE